MKSPGIGLHSGANMKRFWNRVGPEKAHEIRAKGGRNKEASLSDEFKQARISRMIAGARAARQKRQEEKEAALARGLVAKVVYVPIEPPARDQQPVVIPPETLQARREATPTPRHKLRWTREETKWVLEAMATRILAQGWGIVPTTGDRHGSGMLMDFLREAQLQCLKPERRRLGQPLHRGFLKKSAWDQLAAILQRRGKEASGTKPNGYAPAPPVTAPSAPPSVPPREPEAPPAPPQPVENVSADSGVDPLGAFSGRDLMLAGVKKICGEQEIFVDMMVESFAQLQATMRDLAARLIFLEKLGHASNGNGSNGHGTNGNGHGRPKLLKVALVGCQPGQFQEISAKLQERGIAVDLKFIEQSKQSVPFLADYCVHFRFISHEILYACRFATEGKAGRVIQVTGQTAAVERIAALAAL